MVHKIPPTHIASTPTPSTRTAPKPVHSSRKVTAPAHSTPTAPIPVHYTHKAPAPAHSTPTAPIPVHSTHKTPAPARSTHKAPALAHPTSTALTPKKKPLVKKPQVNGHSVLLRASTNLKKQVEGLHKSIPHMPADLDKRWSWFVVLNETC